MTTKSLKVSALILCCVSTFGCMLGGATESIATVVVSGLFFALGFVLMLAARVNQ